MAVFRPQLGERRVVDLLERLVGGDACLGDSEHVLEKGAGLGEALPDLLRRGQSLAAPGDKCAGLQRREPVERAGPVAEMRIAAIGGGAELDQVAGEQHLLLGQPGDRVALGMAAAGMDDLHLARAQPQRHPLVEHDVGPGQAGNGLPGAEQAREALDLGIHVLLAALDDHAARDVAGDDVDPLLVAGDAQHPHGVVVGEEDVADRLVGHLADMRDQLFGHHRRRARVDDQDRIVADHHARVRVALGGQREYARRQLGEGLALLGHIALARERLAHSMPPVDRRQHDAPGIRQSRW